MLSSKPQLFLPVVETCDVLEDKGGVIVREVKFKDGQYSRLTNALVTDFYKEAVLGAETLVPG